MSAPGGRRRCPRYHRKIHLRAGGIVVAVTNWPTGAGTVPTARRVWSRQKPNSMSGHQRRSLVVDPEPSMNAVRSAGGVEFDEGVHRRVELLASLLRRSWWPQDMLPRPNHSSTASSLSDTACSCSGSPRDDEQRSDDPRRSRRRQFLHRPLVEVAGNLVAGRQRLC